MDASDDVWRYGSALGKTKMRIYAELEAGPLDVATMSEILGLQATTVKHHLVAMEKDSLVEREGDVWRFRQRDLSALAMELGVAGRGERQRQQHIREREAFRLMEKQRAEKWRTGWHVPTVNQTL